MNKSSHGGQRKGAGRPRLSEGGRAVVKCVTITPDDLAYLLSLSPNLSEAIRLLIAAARQK
jgi:hypothetical protein